MLKPAPLVTLFALALAACNSDESLGDVGEDAQTRRDVEGFEAVVTTQGPARGVGSTFAVELPLTAVDVSDNIVDVSDVRLLGLVDEEMLAESAHIRSASRVHDTLLTTNT